MSGQRRAIAVLLCACIAAAPLTPASADGVDENKAIATDLFDKGVKKMSEGSCDTAPTNVAACKEARDDFRRAYELYPAALGALRNLAYVEKGLGLVASAARDFRELARKAPLDPKVERHVWADYAREEVKGLDPRIPHLIVKAPSDRPAGTKITLDGATLAEGAWDAQIDVDPGSHSVHAEAPGRLSYDGSVTLAEKQTKTISILLEVDTSAKPIVEGKKSSRVLPLVVAGVGVVGIGVGLGLGYASMKKKDEACGGTKVCDPDGLSQGKSLANTSTIVTGIGAALLISGVVWYLVSPSSSSERSTAIAPFATADAAGVSAFGRF